MHDAWYGGRKFRTFNVIDESNREALIIEVGTSIPNARVIRVRERFIEIYGKPQALRLDNGLLDGEAYANTGVQRCIAEAVAILNRQHVEKNRAKTEDLAIKRCQTKIVGNSTKNLDAIELSRNH